MTTVKFNVVREFCAEVEKDVAEIDRGIVRITGMSRGSSLSPNIRHIFAMASYSVKGQVVILESYCGDVWGINEKEDQKVYSKEKEVCQAVEEICQKLGLKQRGGILEVNHVTTTDRGPS